MIGTVRAPVTVFLGFFYIIVVVGVGYRKVGAANDTLFAVWKTEAKLTMRSAVRIVPEPRQCPPARKVP